MDIRQLRYYKEIVDQGSISKAAERLHIAQPPLSQLLKKLEDDFNTELIRRYRQKWEVTESGELLYRYAVQILGQMAEVKKKINEVEEGSAGSVNVGVSSACYNMLIDYIAEFRAQFPQIKISIHSGDSETLLNKLKQQEIDLALLIRPGNTEQFDTKSLDPEQSILIVPDSWAPSLPAEPALKDIGHLPFIMLGEMEDYSFHSSLLRTFKAHHIEPDIVIECKDIPILVALVNRGLGISIIPRMNYKSLFVEHLRIYEFTQFEASVEPVVMKLRDVPVSKAAEKFWNIVQ